MSIEVLLDTLTRAFSSFTSFTWQQGIMILIGGFLLYLAVVKGYEPLLLVPIGFGSLLVNLPLTGLMESGGILKYFYDAGVSTEIFPALVFIGIGAMTDFEPLLQNPKVLLLGAAGQFGIFLTLILATLIGFKPLEAVAIAVIGACDGPTAIFVSSKYAPHLLGPIAVAAYSYMSLVPIIQPPIMRLLTSKEERIRIMTRPSISKPSKAVKLIFPILVTLTTVFIAPMGAPLIGMLMLGNFLRECGVTERLAGAAQNEIPNIVTLLLGISIGATMQADIFLKPQTLLIYGLGLTALVGDTAAGLLMAKLMNFFFKEKINPLLGAAGISAFPMAARVVQTVGQSENPKNYLIMHAVGANTGGQIGSVVAASIVLSLIESLSI